MLSTLGHARYRWQIYFASGNSLPSKNWQSSCSVKTRSDIFTLAKVLNLLWSTEEERAALLAKLDAIERSVNSIQMPLAYADQFYVLREQIGFVRGG
jgi:hypothetical protein